MLSHGSSNPVNHSFLNLLCRQRPMDPFALGIKHGVSALFSRRLLSRPSHVGVDDVEEREDDVNCPESDADKQTEEG